MVLALEPSLELATGQPDVSAKDQRCHGDAVCRKRPVETRSAHAEPAGGVDDVQELRSRRDERGPVVLGGGWAVVRSHGP